MDPIITPAIPENNMVVIIVVLSPDVKLKGWTIWLHAALINPYIPN